MAKRENKITDDIKKFYAQIKDTYKVKRIFLFGSYSKGTAKPDSDIDVGVVIDGLEKMDEIKVMSKLYEMTKKVNTLIEPFCISYKDYKKPLPTSIVGDIIKSGVTII